MHRFIDSSTHHSFTDSFLTSSSLIHWFTDSQIYPLTNALNDYNHLFIDWLNHRFIGSLKSSTHWFIDSLNHRLATSLAFSLVHRHVIRSLHGSVVHLFNDSILHSLIHWIIGSLIDALVTESCNDSLTHRCIGSPVYWFMDSLVYSVSCAWILSCHFLGVSTTVCSFADAPHNFNSSLLLHRKSFRIGHWYLIVFSYFRTFRPAWAGHYLLCVYIYIYVCVFKNHIHYMLIKINQ